MQNVYKTPKDECYTFYYFYLFRLLNGSLWSGYKQMFSVEKMLEMTTFVSHYEE